MKTKFIINADDLGMSANVNSAILKCMEQGLISDTSIIVTERESFDELKSIDKSILDFSAGVHLCLTRGNSLSGKLDFMCDQEGFFKGKLSSSNLYQYRKEIFDEFCHQIEEVKKLGLQISHLDSHQHIHMRIDLLPIAIRCCKEFKIPYLRRPSYSYHDRLKSIVYSKMRSKMIRLMGVKTVDYFGDYKQVNNSYNTKFRYVEVMCHPAFTSNFNIVDKKKNISFDECDLLTDHLDALPKDKELIKFKELL